MAGKTKINYICNECGAVSVRQYGRCPNCGAWNSMEEVQETPAVQNVSVAAQSKGPVHFDSSSVKTLEKIDINEDIRYGTGMGELDRVLGGGLVKGSVVLIGGSPGIGKSTILLQICQFMGCKGRILYVSGEESLSQIKLRANRLQVNTPNLMLLAENDIEKIILAIHECHPDMIIVDSIQTMQLSGISSFPGSVTQVRESTLALMRTVKDMGIPAFIVGHVNKEGSIAGPKVLEHIVDCVLYFEGDSNLSYRILRAAKNRFGSTNEIGVFDMSDKGLTEVPNPSAVMLSGRPVGVSGTAVTCVLEGTRPILAEVQALVSSGSVSPRRMSTGFDFNRFVLLMAVLEKRAGMQFNMLDAYVNIVGGLKLMEPAADLSVVAALYSSLKDIPIPEDTVIFGEVGLAGEIRSVSNTPVRISEAARLGFKRCIVPKHSVSQNTELAQKLGIELLGVRSVRELCRVIAGTP